MDDYQLLIDLHIRAQRQGPGGNSQTEQAINLAGLNPAAPLAIADIGCGTGASTLTLARHLNATITAVDFLDDFLQVLRANAARAGLSHKITTLARSMEDLPFGEEALDVIWAEGAIYNIGFQRGIREWRRHLKPGGLLAVSEITWLTQARPVEIERHWVGEYPEIGPASAKMNALENSGYTPVGYFILPESCWLDNYYRPIQQGMDAFLQRNGHSTEAQAIAKAEEQEIALYERFKAHYSYGFYLARRAG